MKTMFYHGTTTDGRRFTIAGSLSEEFKTLKLGIAICGTKELFVKKLGRVKAESRLLGSAKRGVLNHFAIDNTHEYYKEFAAGCSEFNNIDSATLKKIFNLYHNDYKS
jgi:hypothetical protein